MSRSMRPESVRVGLFGAGGALGIASLVAGTGNRVLELAPLEPLAGGTQYAVLVSGALRSTSGHAIGGTLQFPFRTRTGSGGGGVVPPPPSQLQATVGRLRQGRRSHTATGLDDGRVLLCGGYVAGTTVTDKGELFDPGTTTFSLIADRMAAPRAGHAAAKLRDGRVLLCGGFYEASVGSLNATAGAELFDPATDTFTEVGADDTSRGSTTRRRCCRTDACS